MEFLIRHATDDDIPSLRNVELSAAALFSTIPSLAWIARSSSSMAISTLRSFGSSNHLWVAVANTTTSTPSSATIVATPVGFACGEPKDDCFYIAEISVHAEWQRRGIARRLLAEVEAQARGQGFRFLSLTTYRDVDWNDRLYRKLGFVEIDPVVEGLRAHCAELEKEAGDGHDVARRCVMRKRLS
ncbi:putative GNAT family acetyltransferase [Podospora appendiculata]|uniref:GNAT family acetyltransferase n=1 Tax=Podospora appendiculata TaxID=314037 RepID=A0AAE0XAD8_9PEZI|nr:putative GNAT family acetyltransferase [Podospora appendiculata]